MAIATKFMRAMDSENYVAAHDLMTSGMKAMLPLNKFVSSEQEFWSMSGGEPVRSDIRVTWYKDPPRAQAPGVYAAIDVNCRYRNIEKCTEVIILHEEAGGFRVMRHERNIFESREDNLNMRDP